MTPRALYFGCLGEIGHFLHRRDGKSDLDAKRLIPSELKFPPVWDKLLDGGLLGNAKALDVYDGDVRWVCAAGGWWAFVWWDNSIDHRKASNSGFYVHGDFGHPLEAFEFACNEWPEVIARQKLNRMRLVMP